MKHFLILALIFSLSGCYKDIKNITIKGVVKNAQTDKPIANANIIVTCWIYGNTPDGSYTDDVVKKIKSNDNGEFECQFLKGAFIFVETSVPGYEKGFAEKYIYKSNNTIDLYLEPK